MTIEKRLAHLLEDHGIGLPRAVSLGGEAAVEAWVEQQELDIEAAARAEAVAEEDAAALAEADTRPFGTPDTIEAIHERLTGLESFVGGAELTAEGAVLDSVLTRLTALESAVDALALSGPSEDAVGEVAAGGDSEPEGTKAPETEAPKDPEPEKPKAGKGKGGKKGGR